MSEETEGWNGGEGTYAEHWSRHPSGTLAASISDWEAVVDEAICAVWIVWGGKGKMGRRG